MGNTRYLPGAAMLAFLGLLLAFILAGCAGLGNDEESDIPWSAPEPWEGSPMIPGMERM